MSSTALPSLNQHNLSADSAEVLRFGTLAKPNQATFLILVLSEVTR